MKLYTTAITGIVGVAMLAACTPVDQPTNDQNVRAKQGAGIGAIAGALIGSQIGDSEAQRRRNAIAGAALGAGGGALIGNNLDKQAAELRSSVDNRIQVINQGNYLVVRMPEDILFAVNSDQVAAGLRNDLAAVANNLNKYPNSTIQVVGHTDNTGTAAYNQDLSQRRAQAVASILVADGVNSGRVQAIGRGESQPIATNQTAAGRAQNRRVEIFIRPNG